MELKSSDATDGSPGNNSYSLLQKGMGRGRFNVRSRYVDVLSKGDQKTVPSLGVAPPSLLPPTTTMQFNPANFFVPQPGRYIVLLMSKSSCYCYIQIIIFYYFSIYQ